MRSKRPKPIFPLLALLLLEGLLSANLAAANTGPHYGAGPGSNANCATCHRDNTSGALKPLPGASNQANFCFTCHGIEQLGADTNVKDGRYSNGEGLRGGGFEYATMDPGLTGTPSNEPVTSAHNIDNSLVRAWGGGQVNRSPDYGNMLTLECGDCHNPHGNGNYRMLRGLPHGMYDEGNAHPVEVPNESVVTYTITYDETTGYRDTSYVASNLGQWCAQCHTRYSAGVAQGHTSSGDAVFTFRHPTESIPRGCLRCHVAHGTTATMGPYSGAVNMPDGSPGGGASDSRLLSTNNRASCAECHILDEEASILDN